jgi:hypothetical protein
MTLRHAPMNAIMTPALPKSRVHTTIKCEHEHPTERPKPKRYIPSQPLVVPSLNEDSSTPTYKPWNSKNRFGNFGTNLVNLFIRLCQNYPFHSLPQRHMLHPDSTWTELMTASHRHESVSVIFRHEPGPGIYTTRDKAPSLPWLDHHRDCPT